MNHKTKLTHERLGGEKSARHQDQSYRSQLGTQDGIDPGFRLFHFSEQLVCRHLWDIKYFSYGLYIWARSLTGSRQQEMQQSFICLRDDNVSPSMELIRWRC